MSLKKHIKTNLYKEQTNNVNKNGTKQEQFFAADHENHKKPDYPIKSKTVNNNSGGFKIKSDFDPFVDPRPDLTEDSKLWEKLFKISVEQYKSNWLAIILHGIRCGGTKIILKNDQHIFEPKVGDHCWPSVAEYQEVRKSWLKPYKKEVNNVLTLLDREVKNG